MQRKEKLFSPVGVGKEELAEKQKKIGNWVFLLWQITTNGSDQEVGLRAVTLTRKRADVFKSLCVNRDKRNNITNNSYRVDSVLTGHLFAYNSLLHKEFLK